MENTLLKIKNLSFKFDEDNIIFDNAKLEIENGTKNIIQGPNGSGKTTLLYILCGIYKCDFDLQWQGEDKKIEDIVTHIGYVPEKPYLYEYLTGEENIILLSEIFKLNKDEIDTVYRYIDDLGLRNDMKKMVKDYSAGMRDKLYFSCVLARNIQLLLMDEPFTTFDADSQKKAMDIVNQFVEGGGAVITISHIKEFFNSFNENVFCIKNRRIVSGEEQ